MKNVLDQLFRWLDKIGKDKYQHFALGSFLALIVFVVAFTLVKFIGHGAAYWIGLGLSAAATMGLEVFKEFYVDVKPDWRDILATMLGGSMVWIALLVAY